MSSFPINVLLLVILEPIILVESSKGSTPLISVYLPSLFKINIPLPIAGLTYAKLNRCLFNNLVTSNIFSSSSI